MSIGITRTFHPANVASLSVIANSVSFQLTDNGESVAMASQTGSPTDVRFGGCASLAASSADLPILPRTRIVLPVNSWIVDIASWLASGSDSIVFTCDGKSILTWQ